MKLRPAIPPDPNRRTIICYGGPLDGATMTIYATEEIPFGYIDFAGALVTWCALKLDKMPLWSGHGFKEAVEEWKRLNNE